MLGGDQWRQRKHARYPYEVQTLMKRIATRVYKKIIHVLFGEKMFPFWQRFGFHITLSHFTQPVPDTRSLRPDLWSSNSEVIGIDMNERKQIELLDLFAFEYRDEYDRFPRNKTSTPFEYYVTNGMFGSVDGEILYCMIRHFKPTRIIEVGSGNSTYLSAQAVMKNRQEDRAYRCELTAIEPLPNDVLKAGFPGLSRLIPKEVQDVPLTEFEQLRENDILFIDSSHMLKIGSDVHYEYLEILPRTQKGVLIHVHDIFLPAEYPKEWILRDYHFYNEQYILQTFLTFNQEFEVLWAGHYMHLRYPERLEAAFSSYDRGISFPRSFWMRRKLE